MVQADKSSLIRVSIGLDLYFEELTRPYEELEPDDRGYDDGVRDTIDRRAAGQLALFSTSPRDCALSVLQYHPNPLRWQLIGQLHWHEAIEPDTECIHLAINLAANQRQAGPNRHDLDELGSVFDTGISILIALSGGHPRSYSLNRETLSTSQRRFILNPWAPGCEGTLTVG